jgi:transcriptional regulator with XRE-family HTH domain
MKFGNFIRNKRLEKGYTLRRFCELVDISPTFISRMERDEIDPPREDKIVAMAQVLSIDAEELVFKANRLPDNIKKMIISRPDLVSLLRIATTRNPNDLKHLVDLVIGSVSYNLL